MPAEFSWIIWAKVMRKLSWLMKLAGILLIAASGFLLAVRFSSQYETAEAAQTAAKTPEISYTYTLTLVGESTGFPVEANADDASGLSPVLLSSKDGVIVIKETDALYDKSLKMAEGSQVILRDREGEVRLYQFKDRREIAEAQSVTPEDNESLILLFTDAQGRTTLVTFDLILQDSDEADI